MVVTRGNHRQDPCFIIFPRVATGP
jgi:hypothetical protein